MKKITSINKSKLAGYTAVAGAIVAGGAANAQITYTDVNPDVTIDSLSSPYLIDFNNDQTPDVGFAVAHINDGGSLSFTYVGAFAYTVGAVMAEADTVNASALDCGVAVSNTAFFGNGSYGILGYAALINGTQPFTSTAAPFLGATDKYLGVSFADASSNTYYGWVKLSVAANAETITIKEYAYNAAAGQAINTCQTAGLNEANIDDKVTIKTTLNSASINVTPDLLGGTLSIVSMSGQTVKTMKIANIDTTISFDGVDTGIYMVNAKFDGGAVNKKVYIK